MGDDFSEAVKRILAARASYICSNPECRAIKGSCSRLEKQVAQANVLLLLVER